MTPVVGDLAFSIVAAEPTRWAVAPQLALKLRVVNAHPARAIHAIALRCQVRIEAPARSYSRSEAGRLAELFGEPGRWPQTMRGLLWAQLAVNVPSFAAEALVDLPLPCGFDMHAVATKFFHALDGGIVPLTVLFAGTVFHAAPDGALTAAPIPWTREASYPLPVALWDQVIDHYYPGCAPILLERGVFERLDRHRARRGLASWDDAIESLLSDEDGARAGAAR